MKKKKSPEFIALRQEIGIELGLLSNQLKANQDWIKRLERDLLSKKKEGLLISAKYQEAMDAHFNLSQTVKVEVDETDEREKIFKSLEKLDDHAFAKFLWNNLKIKLTVGQSNRLDLINIFRKTPGFKPILKKGDK